MTSAEAVAPSNKGMNLTSALPRFARWHGRRSQVMPGVRRTRGGATVGQLIDFYAGDAEAIGEAISALDYETLDDRSKYPFHVDFALHLSPADFDIMTELVQRRIGSGPSSLSESLERSVGGDEQESWAYVVADQWVRLMAALPEERVPELAAAWVEALSEEYGDSSLRVTSELLSALGALTGLCREAERRQLAVVHTWAL